MDQPVALGSDLEVDLAIIGAGAAGLMLAAALASRGRRLRLIVLEPRQLTPNPRLWVFPAQPRHALERFVLHRLDQVRILDRVRPLSRTRLDVVRAGDVQSAALDRLSAAGFNPVEEQVRIDGMLAVQSGAVVQTGRGTIHANCVVDTRPGAFGAVRDGLWTQIGWFAAIRSGAVPPGFALSRAHAVGRSVMLDQSLSLDDGTTLVEVVGLCPPGDDGQAVKVRLEQRLAGLGVDLETTKLIRAVLPLEFGIRANARGPIVHAPAGAGGLRFGPGLAALQLARWADVAAESFTQTGRLIAPPTAPRAQRMAAAQLIKRLQAGPDSTARWLNETVEALPAGAALRFLGGVPGWGDAFTQIRHRWLNRPS
ncbi:lycopene cyclase family protein [Maricaulaceae bacterium EIL42A08]|nr:lycopene cyclase family protein [Maricaulaceae bacterium EIL42A08]